MANPPANWTDFFDEGLGPNLPLSSSDRAQLVSGILPSGEAGGFDFRQQGESINSDFPYPNQDTDDDRAFTGDSTSADFPDQFSDDWWAASGALKTYGPTSGDTVDPSGGSGIFNFNHLSSRFSNAQDADQRQIQDFTTFNPYIHHKRLPSNKTKDTQAITIPFISTYNVSIDFDAYGGWKGFGG